MATFWNSRNKLAFGSLIAVIFLGLLEDRRVEQKEKKPKERDLIEDVDYAVETMQYMAGLPTGKSKVRGVVEKEKEVEEWYWSCRDQHPEGVENGGWIENDGLFLFSAYFDDRANSLFPRNPSIQVLLMSWRSLENKTDVYCTLHSELGSAVVKGFVREIWQRAWDPRDHFYVPALITCPVPIRLSKARSMTVFLNRNPCGTQKTAINVTFPEKVAEKKDVVVCVKGMDFQKDNSRNLVEWLEANFLFGVAKVLFYTYSVPEKVKDVLKYYGKAGKVEEIPLDLPGNSPNIPPVRSAYILRNRQQKRRHELIPYNDCLYRHIGTHKYILILDTDEIVVPLKHKNYGEMLSELEEGKNRNISSVVVRNVFKFPMNQTEENGSELFLLRNDRRSKKTSAVGEYGKSFSRTENVATVFNHFSLHRQSPIVSASIHLPEATAIKLHYKSSCPIESRSECDELQRETVKDSSLVPVSEELSKRVKKVLREIWDTTNKRLT